MNWTEIVVGIIVAATPVILSLLTWGFKKLADLINVKVKNEEVAGILTRLDNVVLNVVKELMQTTVDAAKKSADDKKLPEQIAKDAAQAALDKIKSYFGPAGLEMIKAVLGFSDDATLTAFLKTKVEATVHTVKAQKEVASGTRSAAAALTDAFGITK